MLSYFRFNKQSLGTVVFNLTKLANFHQSVVNNAGHSKWANIRHIKAQKDGQRSAMFTKLSRQIRLAIQEGGSTNPATNTPLKSAIDMAMSKNMPVSTIQNTIKKVEQSKTQLKKHILEMKAFQKVYFVCVLYTDNLTLVKQSLSPLLKKAGGTFVEARHLFEDRGVVLATVNEKILNDVKDSNKIEEICTDDAIDCGAEEIELIDASKGLVNFFCDPVELQRISDALVMKGYQVEIAEHVFIPKVCVGVTEKDISLIDTFIDKIKAIDGVEEIYSNLSPDL